MEFPRLDSSLATVKSHLTGTDSLNTEVEQIFVGFLLAVTYAEYEQAVRRMVVERGKTEDAKLSEFVRVATEHLVKHIKVADLKGLLGFFDTECKQAFHDEINETRAHRAYDSLINDRHAFAHTFSISMTLRDFEEFYPESVLVLEALERALHLK